MENEVWKEFYWYENKYLVSNYGRVRNPEKGNGLRLTKRGNKIQISLSYKGKHKAINVIDIVSDIFPDGHKFDPDNYHVLNRISGLNGQTETLDNEIWRDIQGYEGRYQISNIGRLKSLKRATQGTRSDGSTYTQQIRETMLLQTYNSTGYLGSSLYYAGVGTRCFTHRLVAQAFIPNPDNLPQVNHIDGDKSNNTIENLEWVSAKTNMIHGFTTGLITVPSGAESAHAKLTWEEVRYIRGNPEGMLQKELAAMFGIGCSTVSHVQHYKTYKNDPMEETK